MSPALLSDSLADAVRAAGALALDRFRSAVRTWFKGDASPVCEVDIEVDQFLRRRLRAEAPGYGWLSEESGDNDERLAASRLWIVDPIDGTRAFLAGDADWTIVAALVENGRPILAAVYAPVVDQLFMAVSGAGATRNGTPIAATTEPGLAGARIAGPDRRVDALARYVAVEKVAKGRSLALRLARVAAGEIDIALAGSASHDWDLAAADLLVHEAGGALTDLTGAAPTYNRPEPVHGVLIAAGRARHATLMQLAWMQRAAAP